MDFSRPAPVSAARWLPPRRRRAAGVGPPRAAAVPGAVAAEATSTGIGATLGSARGAAAALWRRRRLRIALLVAAGALALAVGSWQLLRHSSLAAVEHVRIEGARGAQAAQIDAALQRAARGMNTLDVRRGALLAAVSQFPVVRDLRVRASFPHGLRIEVIEQPPVAILMAGGVRTAVAADGVVLGQGSIAGSLPSVHMAGIAPLPGARVAGAGTRAELSVLGAVPPTLLGWVQRVFSGPEGLTVRMRDGLEIYFGNATRPHAKWLAAARVLADPSSAGATYLDVRLPERPAAGSSAGSLGSSSTSTQVGASDPNAAALAATLDEAVAGGSGAAASATTPSVTATAAQTPAPPGAQGESSTTPSSEPSTAPSTESSTAPTTESSRALGGESSTAPGATADPRAGPRAKRKAKPQAQAQVEGWNLGFLGWWSRVRDSASNPAKVVGGVDRAKFPA